MKTTLMLFLLLCAACRAQTVAQYRDAIWRAEGGTNATWPYGVRSVRVSGTNEARRVCERTVRHVMREWRAAGEPGAFVPFLAAVYCPTDRTNWARNVAFWLRKEKTK